jgi:hypothetical protein
MSLMAGRMNEISGKCEMEKLLAIFLILLADYFGFGSGFFALNT